MKFSGKTLWVVMVILLVVALLQFSCGLDDDDQGPEGGYVEYDSWMGDMFDEIGNRKLCDITLPGSHDAGMNANDLDTSFGGNECNTVTQTKNIYHQLMAGSRFFDIRPLVREGDPSTKWRTAHVSNVPVVGMEGCEGEKKQQIIDELCSFFDDSIHKNELVILKLSHCYKYVRCGFFKGLAESLSQNERDRLYLDLTSRLPDDLLVKCHDDCNLMDMTLKEILAKGNIILLMEGDVSAKEIGVFNFKDLPIYDEYANTNDYNKMIHDQMKKLQHQYHRYPNKLFLFSDTLTLSPAEVLACTLDEDDAMSILSLAEGADIKGELMSQLSHWLMQGYITKSQFPNILYLDAFDTDVTDAAIYLNNLNETDDHQFIWESGTGRYPGAHYRMQGDGNLCIYFDGDAKWCSGTGGNPGAHLFMRNDGNWVIYDASFKPVWETGTDGNPGAYYVMGDDGNFVIKDEDGTVLWATHTDGHPGAYFVMGGDGNFVIKEKVRHDLWSTKTGVCDKYPNGNPGARYKMQSDGNFCIYPKETGQSALWASGTGGWAGAYYVMGTDGNFVIKNVHGHVEWQAHTDGHPGAHYEMQDDGNFVVYYIEHRVLWETDTAGNEGAFYQMMDNGNFVIYMPDSDKNKILWQSGTWGSWEAYDHMHSDGNLKIWTEKWNR